MNVHPTNPDPAVRQSFQRPGDTVPRSPVTPLRMPSTHRATEQPDRAEISLPAIKAHEGGEIERPAESLLAPDRLRQVLMRIGDGHYEHPDIQGQTAAKIATALGTLPPRS